MACYVSSKIVTRPVAIGVGLVLTEPVGPNELLIDFERHGERMGEQQAWLHEERGNHDIVQVDDLVYQVTLGEREGIDFLNHSCRPNCGMRGSFQVVARRPIESGEELTIDYALLESHPWYRMACRCGEEYCRSIVTGRDWRQRSLQQEYAGYFATHIQRRIDAGPVRGLWRDVRESTYWGLKRVLGTLGR